MASNHVFQPANSRLSTALGAMNPHCAWLLLAIASVANAASYERIGYVDDGCPATFHPDPANFLPNPKFVSAPALKVTPQEAIDVAVEAGKIQCASRNFKGLFRDTSKYYLLADDNPLEEVAIDGATRAISIRELAGISYTQTFKEYYSRIRTKPDTFPAQTPVLPRVVSTSPNRFATAVLEQTDPVKVPYDQETAHIRVTGDDIEPLYITTRFFRSISLHWATDRILVIKRDIGHVAGMEEAVDVVDHKWLSQHGATFR